MSLSSALSFTIAANKAAQVDGVGRSILDGLNRHGQRYLNTIKLLPEEIAELYTSPNWHGPAIENIIELSEFHRNYLVPPSEGERSLIYEKLISGEQK